MNNQIHPPIRVAALAAALLALTASVGAQVAITDVHVDIGLEQPAGDWGVHIHDEDNDEEYAPDAAYFLADPALAGVTRPSGAQWDFLGGTGGDTIYVLPQGQQAGLPFLGFSSEEVTPGTFDSYFNADSRVNSTARWIGWRITAVSGPGDFSIWQSGQFGTPTVWVSTAQGGLTSADTVFIQEGGHAHFNWGMSIAGTYQVTLVASGRVDGVFIESTPHTFTFSTTAIPEPSTYAALAGVLGLCAATLRRRART